ncbi:restriction endonuclease subunit S [Methylococcus sp. EFPC2]|uniref:restriction endonuclease subunit S n=1 Tax=Methylococcus sp. EFPC2 TaxID=2812648 RepID=UPI0019684737|nr:restriction endonuclease subunit S [Methylococcus sp. EFPC2]QSA97492.1 restriction endonuclease subunit S [Methylococcus sp. EFPC2]
MNLETFFEKFELFADAPSAVAKIRELVLSMAIEGKLTQCPTAIKDWVWVKMRDVCAQITDGEHATPHRTEEGVPLATAKNVRDGFLDLTYTDFVAPATAEKCWKRCKPCHEDILMVCVGATTGRVCLVKNPPDIVLVRSVALIRPNTEKIAPQYLSLFLRSPMGQSQIWRNVKQSAQPCLYLGRMSEFTLLLPSLAEQKRIVAKVDELMALCDRLEAQQKERQEKHAALARASLARFAEAPTPANLDFLFHKSYDITPADLRKTILTLAVQGKLIPQVPNDEPAAATFARLATSASETGDDDLPECWLSVPLGKLGEWRGGGTPSKSRPDFWSGELPWVSPKDMKVQRIEDAQDHISHTAVESSAVRIIPPGSLLMVVRGMILARSFPVALTMRDVAINQDMKALLPFESDTTEFLLLVLRALEPKVLAVIERSTHGTCKLETKVLHNLGIPLPPLAEQRRIVATVDQLMALVDQLETQLAASRANAAKLMEALVAELTGSGQSSQTHSATRKPMRLEEAAHAC